VIVNADDFGWSEAVTSGILQGHLAGVLTSTTLMANLPGAAAALERARREAPGLGLGLHLNLTEGRPLLPAARLGPLVNERGEFRRSVAAVFRAASWSAAARAAVAAEWEAQAAWAADHGLRPTHFDSHKHVHLYPALLPVALELARRHGVRAIRTTAELRVAGLERLLPAEGSVKERLRQWVQEQVARRWGRAAQRAARAAGLATTDWFFGIRATGAMTAGVLGRALAAAPQGTGEIMVHPGLAEAPDGRPTRLGASRPKELAALGDGRLRAAAAAGGVTWISYKELCDE
jgi:hopanoid biosynthesis associated protein HpnK